MKALSLMLWLVSSENWLTFEKRLWRTRVDGPDGGKRKESTVTYGSPPPLEHLVLTPPPLLSVKRSPSCVEASTRLQG